MTSCLPALPMSCQIILRRISPQKSVRMYADFVLMQALLCGAETMRWRHSMKCWHGRNPRNSITIISICMSTSFRKSSKKRIRRNSTGRHPRLQVEITKTAMRKMSAIPITGAYGTEASRLPLIVPTITVSCPSSDSSPSRPCRL